MRALPPPCAAESEKLCENLYNVVEDLGVLELLVFLPTGKEPDLYPLYERLLAAGYRLFAPRCKQGGAMEFFRFRSLADCVPGLLGIMEPQGDELPSYQNAAALVPGFAFTKKGLRLGKGGGYYDRFLRAHQIETIGVCLSAQIVEDIPTEPHDVPVGRVVTERTE